MFELLFKYPASVFSSGRFVLLSGLPVWVLLLAALFAAGAIAWLVWRAKRPVRQAAALWALETALLVTLLVMLWQPALSVSMLKSRQNVVSIVIDDSRSMALNDVAGQSRKDALVKVLNAGVLNDLQKKFQVRLYRLTGGLERIERLDQLTAAGTASRIGGNLRQLVDDSSTLPVGAIVLLSDGSDTGGGISESTIAQIRSRRIPVHTVGFGNERAARDVEISNVELPSRVLAESRVAARVSVRQYGFAKTHTKLTVRDGTAILASRDVVLPADGVEQSETITFFAGSSGARDLQITFEPVAGEENVKNNTLTRILTVDTARKRILYIEGEPRWDFKFIRRAVEEDKSLSMLTMLRTSESKIYRQGIDSPKELEEGFPDKPEDLFPFRAVIVGGVESNYFSTAQQELLKQFVDRRGGGLLFLAGRFGLTEGGYDQSRLADLLPVALPNKKVTFFRDPSTAELTAAGRENLICRLEEDPEKNAARWKRLPYMADFQEVGAPKAGATVLAELTSFNHGKLPLLAIQNYGHGRTALLATSGTWRWQMLQALGDKSDEIFWQQLMRWLVAESPGRVAASTPHPLISDDGRIAIQAQVRDRNYLPDADASVEARISGPDGFSATIPLLPNPATPGEYQAEWNAEQAGSYGVEVTGRAGKDEVGRDVFSFRREDGAAENFHLEQNRELLQKLSEQTGGHYYKPADLSHLTEDVAYSEAGVAARETKELWNMPAVFLAILLLRGGDWLLRRKWGAV